MIKLKKIEIYDEFQCKKLPYHLHGVYILVDKLKQPLYVGSSLDLRNRLHSHFRRTSKNTRDYMDKVEKAIVVITNSTYKTENSLIVELDPPLNIMRSEIKYDELKQKEPEFLDNLMNLIQPDLWSQYESGTKYPRIDRAYEIANVLGVDVNELYEEINK